VFRLHQVTSLM